MKLLKMNDQQKLHYMLLSPIINCKITNITAVTNANIITIKIGDRPMRFQWNVWQLIFSNAILLNIESRLNESRFIVMQYLLKQ